MKTGLLLTLLLVSLNCPKLLDNVSLDLAVPEADIVTDLQQYFSIEKRISDNLHESAAIILR